MKTAKTYPGYENNYTQPNVKITYELRYYENKKSVTYSEVFDGIYDDEKEAIEYASTLTQLHGKRLHIAKVVTVIETNTVVWTPTPKSLVVPEIEKVRIFVKELAKSQPAGTRYQFYSKFNKEVGLDSFEVDAWLEHGVRIYSSQHERDTITAYAKTLGFVTN